MITLSNYVLIVKKNYANHNIFFTGTSGLNSTNYLHKIMLQGELQPSDQKHQQKFSERLLKELNIPGNFVSFIYGNWSNIEKCH